MSLTAVDRVYNFSAGPAVLPEPVLEQIQHELLALPGIGISILEISHRSKEFGAIADEAKQLLRELLSVPEDYEILFLQGGARLQNAMIPMNLIADSNQTADYILTGSWGKKSAEEVFRFGKLNTAWNGSDDNYSRIPTNDQLSLTKDAAYVHYTSNETIQGVQFAAPPQVSAPLVADCSSDFLSRPIDVSQFGLIYACAQKNAGAAGLTVVIIRKDLMERSGDRLAGYLDYAKHASANSMFNTPPTFAIYVSGLVSKWLRDEIGGLESMAAINREKAELLYDCVDAFPGFYQGHAAQDSRSLMNVVFRLPDDEMTARFLEQAASHGLATLKGHRSLGGVRASIYNAMPMAGIQSLVNFMTDFAKQNA